MSHVPDPRSSNQSMKPTAPFRNAFSVLATTPCRCLSPSRYATRGGAVPAVTLRHSRWGSSQLKFFGQNNHYGTLAAPLVRTTISKKTRFEVFKRDSVRDRQQKPARTEIAAMKALLAVALSSSLLLGCRQPKVEHQARDPEAERISAEIRKMAGESAQDLDWFTDEITKIPGNALSCNPRIAANRPLHPHFKANAAARRKSFACVGRVSGVSQSLSLSTPARAARKAQPKDRAGEQPSSWVMRTPRSSATLSVRIGTSPAIATPGATSTQSLDAREQNVGSLDRLSRHRRYADL